MNAVVSTAAGVSWHGPKFGEGAMWVQSVLSISLEGGIE